MFKQLLRGVMVCTVILVVSCSRNNKNQSVALTIGTIDIKNAKTLMVSPRTATSGRTFVKVKSDGSIEQVNIYSLEGAIILGKVPTQIFNASDAYVIIVFGNTVELVNKADGTAYDLTPAGAPDMGIYSGYRSTKRVFSDSEGNIYYVCNGRIKKINVANPDRITVENYTTDLDTVYEFAVDSSGNALYSRTGNYNNPMLAPCRIRKVNGGLYNTGSEYKGFVTGLDGNLYCNSALVNNGSSSEYAIYRINIDPSYNVSFVQYSNVGSTVTDWGHVLYFSDRILNVNCQSQYIHEVYTSVSSPRPSTQVAALANGINVKQSDTYFYVAKSDGSIIRFSPVDYSYTPLMSNNEYEFYNFDVTSDDTVFFNALRLSDGKKVIGKISSSGVVTIMDDAVKEDILILQKI